LCFLTLVVAGIIMADQLHQPGWLLLFCSLILSLCGIVLLGKGNTNYAVAMFGLGLFCFSAYHFSVKYYNFGPDHISQFVSEGKYYQIFGKVADWPSLKSNRTEIKIAIDSLGRGQIVSAKGAILLKVSDTTTALQRGDRIEFRGIIYPIRSYRNPGAFDYARYLQLQEVFGIVYLTNLLDVRVDKSNRFGIIGLVDHLRAEIKDSFKRNLSPTSAALASGFLIGETRDIPTEIYSYFRDSGTLHLMAVSGSNVALVVFFIIFVLNPFALQRKKRAAVLMAGVFIFALLSYGEPSVVRASLMAALVLIATILERRYDLNQIIATAALIILLVDPAQLFEVGFQLSFVTAWGLIFITPQVANLFQPVQHKWWYRWLVFPFLISLIAQICSTPLIAFYFGRVPAISVVANLVIVPLSSLAVVGVLLLLVSNLVWPMLALFFGSLIDSFLKIVVMFLEFFGGEQSLLVQTGDLSVLAVILIYSFIIILPLAIFNKMARRVIVMMIIIVLNMTAAFSIVAASTDKGNTRHLDTFKIPGGLAVLVYQSESSLPDLVITGINYEDYPIEERVCSTVFASLKVKKISRIFVLSAEYGAMDDLLRLAYKMSVREMLIDQRLMISYTDITNHLPTLIANLKIEPFSASSNGERRSGFFPSKNGLIINFGNSEVFVVNDLSPLSVLLGESITNRELKALIVGNSGSIENEELEAIEPGRFSTVICSDLKQSAKSIGEKSSSDALYSIDTQGACRLNVPANQSDTFSIEPLQ